MKAAHYIIGISIFVVALALFIDVVAFVDVVYYGERILWNTAKFATCTLLIVLNVLRIRRYQVRLKEGG
jgi:Na+/H+ antiporter NhaA